MPGTFNQDYTYPSTNDINYFVSTKKMTAIRLPFRWERVQRSFNSSFDVDEQARLTAAVTAITSRGAVAIIEPHNYARYKISGSEALIGSAQVPYGNFYDFWFRMATLFSSNNLVWFNLVNEPNSMDTAQWRVGAQHGINVRGQNSISVL
jgi:endoglucanase